MNPLNEYWNGVVQRLELEFAQLNRLVEHNGERGRLNELALVDLLSRFLPADASIATGFVINDQGETSKQTDIIVYDANAPLLLGQSTPRLFPAETVRVCIEVKSSLRARDLKDAGSKIEELHSVRAGAGSQFLTGLFSYTSNLSADSLARHFRGLKPKERPHIACVLDRAFVAMNLDLVHNHRSGPKPLGVTPRHDGPDRHLQEFEIPSHSAVGTKTSKRPNTSYVPESARALLIFLEFILVATQGQQQTTLSNYLTPEMRDMMVLARWDD